MNNYYAEYTDTDADGSANCCWIRKQEVQAKNSLASIRKIKAGFGLTNVRCRKEDYGDSIVLFPSHSLTRVDIYIK